MKTNNKLTPGEVQLPECKMVLNQDVLGTIADGLLDMDKTIFTELLEDEVPERLATIKAQNAVHQAHLVLLMLHAGAPE